MQRSAFRSNKIKLRPSFPQVQLDVEAVPFVKKLIRSQLLIAEETLSIIFLVVAEQKVSLHRINRNVRDPT